MTITIQEGAAMRADAVPQGDDDLHPLRRGRLRELLVALAVLLLGVAVLLSAQLIAEGARPEAIGPRWWPSVLGIVLIIGAGALGFTARRPGPPAEDEPASAHGALILAGTIALVIGYGVLWQQGLHFVPSTVLLLVALMLLWGGRGWRALLLFPAVIAAILYGVFGLLLRVPL